MFTIEPDWGEWRYLLTGGHTLDVRSPYGSNSVDRGKVLEEARRRWGGKKDDWRIEGVARLEPEDGDAP